MKSTEYRDLNIYLICSSDQNKLKESYDVIRLTEAYRFAWFGDGSYIIYISRFCSYRFMPISDLILA
jgi:hypothetical protein